MKKVIYIISAISFFLTANAQEHVAGQPIYLTVNTTQANQTSSTSYATAFSYALCKQMVVSYYDLAFQQGKSLWTALYDHVYQYKYRYAIYAVIGGYTSFILYIQHINYFMSDKQRWHNWTNGLSIDTLYTVEHHKLAQQLIEALQNRYFNIAQPTNKINPIIQFFIALQEEKNCIQQYISFVNRLEKWHINKLPGILLPDYALLKQAKRHLDFLEQLVKEWCITHAQF
ncbi:hypothetical protein EKK58_04175 [Candidatus Dependentiae bacterium]|nr:MAG: hypothetical protein EKK58_04175 [Candidatus Dependentiae bacterium]